MRDRKVRETFIGRFLKGERQNGAPFMPILMRFCARYTGTPYRDFILDPEAHCRSNIACAKAFGSDWVNVMSDPYGELEAYGAHIDYPEDSLPNVLDVRKATTVSPGTGRMPRSMNAWRWCVARSPCWIFSLKSGRCCLRWIPNRKLSENCWPR